VLCERCRDKALLVRKQSMTSLTEVLSRFQNNPEVHRYFANEQSLLRSILCTRQGKVNHLMFSTFIAGKCSCGQQHR
jgi:hypothetical protein